MSAKHFKESGAPARKPEPNGYGAPEGAAGNYAGSQAPASGPYAGPYEAPEESPYVSGPATGAVGMRSEQVGPGYGRKAKRGPKGAKGESKSPEAAPGERFDAGVYGGVYGRRRRRRVPVLAVILVVLVALVGGGAYLYLNPPLYGVTVNGTGRNVMMGTTLQGLIDEHYASPTAGDLIAVDGSVAKEGGGDPFEATINGGDPTSDPSTPVPRGATVTIDDGNDVDEDYTETVQSIPHGQSSTDMNSFNEYWAGSIHLYSEGQDGSESVRTGKVSGKTVTVVTKQPTDSGYQVYTTKTGDDKVVALTFDDGPWPTTTSEILDILKENDAKATFFEIGNQIAENADVVGRIHKEGHQIGTHTWDHASGSGGGVDLTKMSPDEQVQEVEKGFQAIDQAIGEQTPRILRAPGGNYHGDIIPNLKDYVVAEVGWNVDTEDWRKPGADKIEKAILSVKPGDVVLMHDGGGDRSETVAALKEALPKLREQGYKFVTINELLAYGTPSGNAVPGIDASAATASATGSAATAAGTGAAAASAAASGAAAATTSQAVAASK